jgi:hypothetical protein
MTGILNLLAGSISSAIKDTYFNLTTLLLPGDGTNGAQNNTFLDSSSNNFTITRNGNTTQGTFSPFSQTGWSNFLGTGNFFSAAATSVASSASTFTVEAWIYMTQLPTTGGSPNNMPSLVGDFDSAGSNYWSFGPMSDGKLRFFWFDGASKVVTGDTVMAANTWYHVAISVNSNAIKMFVNGVEQTLTGTTTLTNRSGTLTLTTVGQYGGVTSTYFGYVSNLRITNTAVYTAAFTPSTSALTAITGTQILVCQSNRFVDANTQATAKTLTINGTPSIQAFSPFAPTAAYSAATNGGSGYFDGNGDYLSIANTANLQFGSGDFTLEFFVYFNALSGNQTIYDKGYTGTNAFVIQTNTNTGTMIVYANGTAIITASSASPVGQWDHYAVVRSGTTITLYRNGVSVGSATNSVNFNNAAVTNIGAGLNQTNSTYTAFANAYISNVRLVKGSAVYTAPFTPPTAPHTAITNTQLLLNFTNGGIIDATGKNVLETVGNAQISTTQSKFGGSSMYFDGTGDYLDAPQSDLYSMRTGNFTLEFWIYFSSTSGTQVIYTGRNTTTPYIQLNSGALQFGFSGGPDNVINYTWNPSATTWYHVAFVRSSGTLSLYINGTSAASASNSTDWATPAYARIAANNSGASAFNGYLDDFRLTKGYARYTSNFTAPTAAFPVQ